METPTDTATLVSALLKWVSLFSVADETEDVTRNLIGLITAYDIKGKRIHDANIVAAMMTYRIPNLLTMNADDFKSFNEIKLMELDL